MNAQADASGRDFNVYTEAGVVDDGATDGTSKINDLLGQAAQVGAGVVFPATEGKGYVISGSGLLVPQGTRLLGLGADLDRQGTSPTLRGVFLMPADTSTTALVTFGKPGTAANAANPHGSGVTELGFLGTTPGGATVHGLVGVLVNDTADITIEGCRALNIDPTGAGGAFFYSSTFAPSGNNISAEGGHIIGDTEVYGCGYAVKGDGPGCTDGEIHLRANECNRSVWLGDTAGGGGWKIRPGTHLSGTGNIAHLVCGPTVRSCIVHGVYFDVAGQWQIYYGGTGLYLHGSYFKYGSAEVPGDGTGYAAINLYTEQVTGPRSILVGNDFYVNGSTTVQAFVRLGIASAPFSLICRDTLIENQDAGAPGTSFVSAVVNNAASTAPPEAITSSVNGDIAANSVAW